MFTGIVESIGSVAAVNEGEGARLLTISAPDIAGTLGIGASIAINGTCLTVTEPGADLFVVEAVPETLDLTNLGRLEVGDIVNLERPLAATGRFDGHIVQGHVDGVGEVEWLRPEGDGKRIRIRYPSDLGRYLVHKGSITVDGISLTVARLDEEAFEVAVIPHTMEVTALGRRRPGDLVNLEVDVVAKYVERMLERS